jgi:hypothetical protein
MLAREVAKSKSQQLQGVVKNEEKARREAEDQLALSKILATYGWLGNVDPGRFEMASAADAAIGKLVDSQNSASAKHPSSTSLTIFSKDDDQEGVKMAVADLGFNIVHRRISR